MGQTHMRRGNQVDVNAVTLVEGRRGGGVGQSGRGPVGSRGDMSAAERVECGVYSGRGNGRSVCRRVRVQRHAVRPQCVLSSHSPLLFPSSVFRLPLDFSLLLSFMSCVQQLSVLIVCMSTT